MFIVIPVCPTADFVEKRIELADSLNNALNNALDTNL